MPFKLVSRIARYFESSGSSIMFTPEIPALLTKTWMAHHLAMTSATVFQIWFFLRTSTGNVNTGNARASNSAAAASSRERFREQIATRAPFFARLRLIALPIPVAPPVTMATLFMNINAKCHEGQRISSRFYVQKQENVIVIRCLFTPTSVNAEAGPQSKG